MSNSSIRLGTHKNFERYKYLALKKRDNDYNILITFPTEFTSEFLWWHNNILHSVNPIRTNNFTTEIYTDASTTGWGAACNGETFMVSGKKMKVHIISTIWKC